MDAPARRPGGPNLNVIRGNLFERAAMRVLLPDFTGPDNDLEDLLAHHVERAIEDPQARVHVIGSGGDPKQRRRTRSSNSSPGTVCTTSTSTRATAPGFAGTTASGRTLAC
jgi:uncharacterized protein YukJ